MERTERSAAERAGAAKRTACVLRCAGASAAKTAEAQKARLEIWLEAFSRCALLCDHLGGVAWRIRRDDSKRRHQCAVFRSEQQCCVHNLARGERRHELGYEREQRRHGFRDERPGHCRKAYTVCRVHPELSGDTELRLYADRHVGQQRFPGERRLRHHHE